MLKEALALIQETAQKAREVRPLAPSADGRKERFDLDGKITEYDVPPVNRKHSVYSLAELIDYVDVAAEPVVWYARWRVVLILDDNDRRDRVTFEMNLSEQMEAMAHLANAPAFSQRALLDFLRFSLDVPAETVNLFRVLNWADNTQAASTLGRGKESVGMQLRAECSGTDELPDELTVNVPVYCEFGEREPWPVRLLIEIDTTSQTFRVRPAPGSLDAAIQRAQQSIGERLGRVLKCPTYYGAPS